MVSNSAQKAIPHKKPEIKLNIKTYLIRRSRIAMRIALVYSGGSLLSNICVCHLPNISHYKKLQPILKVFTYNWLGLFLLLIAKKNYCLSQSNSWVLCSTCMQDRKLYCVDERCFERCMKRNNSERDQKVPKSRK